MSLTVTTQGILQVTYPDADTFYVVQAPSGELWLMTANGITGEFTVQDGAIGPPVTLILYDANNTPWQITVDDGGILTVTSFDQNLVLAPAINAAVLMNGLPAVGYQLAAFQGGTLVGVTTYKNGLFVTQQPTPILLNDFGLPTDPVFIIVGQAYKFQLLPPGGGQPVKEWDYVIGGIPLNLANATEWGQSFSASFRTTVKAAIQGDARATFPIGRRIRAVQSLVSIYHTVKQSTYDGTETVLEVEAGGTDLNAGLVTIQAGMLSPTAGAVPARRHVGNGTILAGGLTVNIDNGLNVLPVSAIMLGLASAIPDGWLRCNGQAVSRTTYASLFGSIGTFYGVGNGSTTFNIPNIPDVGTLSYLIYAKG